VYLRAQARAQFRASTKLLPLSRVANAMLWGIDFKVENPTSSDWYKTKIAHEWSRASDLGIW
jgi:hypothetical protein